MIDVRIVDMTTVIVVARSMRLPLSCSHNKSIQVSRSKGNYDDDRLDHCGPGGE